MFLRFHWLKLADIGNPQIDLWLPYNPWDSRNDLQLKKWIRHALYLAIEFLLTQHWLFLTQIALILMNQDLVSLHHAVWTVTRRNIRRCTGFTRVDCGWGFWTRVVRCTTFSLSKVVVAVAPQLKRILAWQRTGYETGRCIPPLRIYLEFSGPSGPFMTGVNSSAVKRR